MSLPSRKEASLEFMFWENRDMGERNVGGRKNMRIEGTKSFEAALAELPEPG